MSENLAPLIDIQHSKISTKYFTQCIGRSLNVNEKLERFKPCAVFDCHFGVCNQAEQRDNNSYRDMIGRTRLNLRSQLEPMHQNDNRM